MLHARQPPHRDRPRRHPHHRSSIPALAGHDHHRAPKHPRHLHPRPHPATDHPPAQAAHRALTGRPPTKGDGPSDHPTERVVGVESKVIATPRTAVGGSEAARAYGPSADRALTPIPRRPRAGDTPCAGKPQPTTRLTAVTAPMYWYGVILTVSPVCGAWTTLPLPMYMPSWLKSE
jgi:hypothetical protein